jgi:hypothetical protein
MIPSVKDNASSPPPALMGTTPLTIWSGFVVGALTLAQIPPVFGVVPTSGVLALLKLSEKTIAPELEGVADRIAMNPITAQ